MSPSRRACAALAFILAFSSSLLAAPIRVTGRVQSEKAGLSGARVELFPAYESYADAVRRLMEKTAPAPLVKARTDAEGDFEVVVPESGCYRVEVRAEGYLAEEFPLVPLVEDVELPPTMLMRGSPVEVRAVGPDGRPLAGIEVRGLNAAPWERRIREGQFRTWRLIPPRATTNGEGRASLSWFKVYGPPSVEAVSPRFLGQKAAGKPEETITLRLIPGRSGWIEARDADGKPVPGALARWNGWPVGITGPDGRLEIAVPEGESVLTLESREGWGARVERAEGKGILPVRLSPPHRISGRVVDSVSRKPVAGAVAWSGFPLVAPAVRTDAEGLFSLGVPTDEGGLEAGAAGFLPGERQPVKKGAQPAVLTLSPEATLSGTVVDKAGRPVAGVRIMLAYMKGRQGLQAMALSREDGGFRFLQLPPGGTFDLTAVRSGFARTTATARTAPAGQPSPSTRIVMEDGQTAFGRVVDQGGRPIAGATVRLSPGNQSLEAISDEEGRFEFRHLSPGRISVLATHPEYAPAFLNRFEIPSGNPRVDLGLLRLPPGEFIEGRVTNSRGAPVEGAAVWVHPGEGRNPWMFQESEEPEPLRTAPDGTFRAGNLEGGQGFHVRVEHSGYVTASLPGVEAPTQQPLQIELKTARSLSGRVTSPEGEPVADASVEWFQAHGGGGYSSHSLGTSDAEGRFLVTGFPPGPLSLAVSAEGFVTHRLEGIQIPGDREPEELQITLERAIALEVRVLNAEGEPVPDARIFAEPVEPEKWEDGRPSLFLHFARHGPDRTDAAGRCRLTVPKPGSYWVSASKQGPPVRTQVAVRPGSNAVELRFPAGAAVSGRVVDEKGAVVPHAAVRLQQTEGLQQRTMSGADGTFVFSEIPKGEYRLAAALKGLTSEELPVTMAGQPVQGIELRLDRQLPGATLTGRILGLPPEEVSGLMVSAYRSVERSEPVQTNREGVYRIEKLAPGEWQVQALTFDGRAASATVEIPPGVPAVELDLEFTGFTLTGRILVDGAPLSGAELQAHDKKNVPSRAQTAYDGTFRLRNVSPGPITLVISGPEGLGGVRNLTVTGNQDIKIELATGRLTGAVVSATGEPVEDALVRLVAWLPDLQMPFGESVARTGAGGTFEIPRLGAGTYKVKVSKEGFAPAEAIAEVRPGGSAPVAVVLKPQEGAP